MQNRSKVSHNLLMVNELWLKLFFRGGFPVSFQGSGFRIQGSMVRAQCVFYNFYN